jgi:twitching motility protein PilT
MTTDQQTSYRNTYACDFAFDVPGVGRCRANAFRQYRGAACVVRLILPNIRTLDALNLPKILGEFVSKPQGLILLTGPTGCGKSTTQNAMILHRNNSTYSHIITIEDPIEQIHTPIRCVVSQRELGTHTQSSAEALRSALREDPDVIVVGEMRDLDTIRLALRAAETGHLVMATLHTSSAPKTIDRIIDVFPGNEKEVVRNQLSESLVAVWSQRLCWSLQKQAVLASELLIGTPAVRNLIRESKMAQLYSTMQAGSQSGMYTLDYSLADLVNRKVISPQEARSKALNPEAFSSLMRG